MPIPTCSARRDDYGTKCEELEGHTPLELGGRKYDHAAHSLGIAWNVETGAEPKLWESELSLHLPAHAFVTTKGFEWTAAWTTPAGQWAILRTPSSRGRGALVHIAGPKLECKVIEPTIEHVIAVLRLRGALDDPAVTGVSWEARRFLADEFAVYTKECAGRLADNGGATSHEEAHLLGMVAGISWLRGEISAPPERKPIVEVTDELLELTRDAWALISKAHGGQPWEAAGAWRDIATEWRNWYRQGKPTVEMVEAAAALIQDAVGNQGDGWESAANAWRERVTAWQAARS